MNFSQETCNKIADSSKTRTAPKPVSNSAGTGSGILFSAETCMKIQESYRQRVADRKAHKNT